MTRLSPLAILFVSVGLVACGGDDGDAPSKQEFAKDAEGICRNAEKGIAKIGGSAEPPRTSPRRSTR
jgi:hypothetical protein